MTITRQLEMGSLLNFAVLILYKATIRQIKIILAAAAKKYIIINFSSFHYILD